MNATFDLRAAATTVDISMTVRIKRLSITSEGDGAKYREARLRASASHSTCPPHQCGGGTWLAVSRSEWVRGNEEVSMVDREETVQFTMTSWGGPIPPGTITITLDNYDDAWAFGQEWERVPGVPYCDTMITVQCQSVVPVLTPGRVTVDLSLLMSRIAVTPL